MKNLKSLLLTTLMIALPMTVTFAQSKIAQFKFTQLYSACPSFAHPEFVQIKFAQPKFAQRKFDQPKFAQRKFVQPQLAQH